MKIYSLDRIEEDYVVLVDDDGERMELKRSRLPASVREGSIIIYEAGVYRVDSKTTGKRRRNNVELKNRLFGLDKNQS